MEGMISVDGLKITEEVAIEFMRDTDPDAAPVKAEDFFSKYIERRRQDEPSERQHMAFNLIKRIEKGGRWTACDGWEVRYFDGIRGDADFMAFDWFRDRFVEIEWDALPEYLDEQVNLWENAREELEKWIRAHPNLKEGEDWMLATEDEED